MLKVTTTTKKDLDEFKLGIKNIDYFFRSSEKIQTVGLGYQTSGIATTPIVKASTLRSRHGIGNAVRYYSKYLLKKFVLAEKVQRTINLILSASL